MTRSVGRVVDRAAHPRLAAVTAVGLALLVAGGIVWLAGGQTAGFRLAILGYLVALASVAGYVAVTVFERRDRGTR